MNVTKSIFGKCIGLMFNKPYPLVLAFNREHTIGLHTFFMRDSIDVFFLDKDRRVVEIKRKLTPWKFYTSKKKAIFAYETPVNSTKLKLGSKIKF